MRGPWRTVEDVELATLGWVHWRTPDSTPASAMFPEPSATLTLFGGGVVLASIGVAGVASATRDPVGRPWLGRWLVVAVIVTIVVVVA